MTPLVSILIPAYNAERSIGETLRSALAQTWPRTEIIVVDDGSKDDTLSAARRFEGRSVKVVTQPNQGAATARNTALSLSQGDYIQWLDADDLLHPAKIASQMRYAQSAGFRVLFSAPCGHFFHNPRRATFKRDRCWQDFGGRDWLVTKFEQGFGMLPLTWLASRELLERIGPWDVRLTLDDDGEYSCRMVAHSDYVKFIGEAACYYRRGNPRSLGSVRSDPALRSLLLASTLSVKHLLQLEDSPHTRKACVAHLRNAMREFYPHRQDLIQQMDVLARPLDIRSTEVPEVSRRLRCITSVVGWRAAAYLKTLAWDVEIAIRRETDRLLYWLEGCQAQAAMETRANSIPNSQGNTAIV